MDLYTLSKVSMWTDANQNQTSADRKSTEIPQTIREWKMLCVCPFLTRGDKINGVDLLCWQCLLEKTAGGKLPSFLDRKYFKHHT